MRYFLYVLLITLLGCQSKEATIGPERIAEATIYDSSMYADGCMLHLQLDSGSLPSTGTQYKPTSASRPLVQRLIDETAPDPNNMVRIPVLIRFRETQQQSVIVCGWVSPTVTEITISDISRR